MIPANDQIARAEIAALDRRLTEAMAAQKDAVTAALNAAEKAVIKAENAAERRFEAVNEFRSSLSDQQHTFITRKEAEALFAIINTAIHRLETTGAAGVGRASGIEWLWRAVVTVGSLAVAAVAAVAVFLGVQHR